MLCTYCLDGMRRNKSYSIICLFQAISFFSLIAYPHGLLADNNRIPTTYQNSPGIVLQKNTQPPYWMKLWEKARVAGNKGEIQEAIRRYQELLHEKPQIEEALREYVVLLMTNKQWDEASKISRKLLGIDSDSLEYQLYAGRIALVLKHYTSAAKYMGQVYSAAPDGNFSHEALRGQIKALQSMGRKEMAHPLMEQLYLLIPHEEAFLRELAQSSKSLGYDSKARQYYRTLLTEFKGTDADFLESEPLFQADHDMEMALKCWLGYVKLHPYYIPFQKKLSEYYLKNGQEHRALEHFLIRIAHGEKSSEIFLQTGRLYINEEGRPDKALYYYEEYRQRNPHDEHVRAEIKRIQAILANDLLVIVENEGAWNLWRDLAKVIPDRLAVYYSMAEQLEKLSKKEELLEVLKIIRIHNPSDQKIQFKLARLYFTLGHISASAEMLDSLRPSDKQKSEYVLLRAEIAESNKQISQALGFYKLFLEQVPKEYSRIVKCIKLAGEFGLVEQLKIFYKMLPSESEHPSIVKEGKSAYCKALITNNLYSQAENLCNELKNSGGLDEDELKVVERQLTNILLVEEKYFEAEQYLRILLTEATEPLDRISILRQLIQTNLLNKDWTSAWKWYELLALESQPLLHESINNNHGLFVDKIEILKESGQVDVAIEMLEDFLLRDDSPCLNRNDQCKSLRVRLSELYFFNEDFEELKLNLAQLIVLYPDDIELKILDQVVSQKLGQAVLVYPVGNYLARARIYWEYGENIRALELCKKFLAQYPNSLRAKVLKAKISDDIGADYTSLAIFKELTLSYPDEEYFKEKLLQKQFDNAKFRDLIEELAPAWKTVKSAESTITVRKVVADIKSLPMSQKLLLARAFWADNRRAESLLLYNSMLNPAVDQLFTQQLNARKIDLIIPPPQKTFLNLITFSTPAEPNRLEVVMKPEFTRDNLYSPVVQVASRLYALYRWQLLVGIELSVKKAMNDGNYYQAMKQYQHNLGPDSSPESLYDLAGIYSQLGFSGKEAALYKIIKRKSPGYPNLDEAVQRNKLKREPRITPLYTFSQKEGREGHYDIQQQAGGFQATLFPTLKHDMQFDVRRIYNESVEIDDGFWRNRMNAEIRWSPIYDLDFMASTGFDQTDNEKHENTILFGFLVNGRLGDIATGHLRLSQDTVDDTLEAVKEGIEKKEYGSGLTLDILPRLFAGGDYLFTEYSDGNYQNRYELWTSYVLVSEPTLLKVRYGYEYLYSAEGNLPRDYSFDSGFHPDDHPYWSPKEYWQHLFTISFKHLLAENILGRGAPSYYTLDYSFGYESGGYDNHEFKGQIFLEMSRHFLLNSSFKVFQGADAEETAVFGSVIYRW